MPEVDDDQLAALRRLRAAFGFVEAVSNDRQRRRTSGPKEVTLRVVSPR